MGYANSKHQVSANYWAVLHETSSSMTSMNHSSNHIASKLIW